MTKYLYGVFKLGKGFCVCADYYSYNTYNPKRYSTETGVHPDNEWADGRIAYEELVSWDDYNAELCRCCPI